MGKAKKAYDNHEFIHSREGRNLRILAEYSYPESHFRKMGIKNTIIFFGSARTKSREEVQFELDKLNEIYNNAKASEKKEIKKSLEDLQLQLSLSKYYEEAYELSKKISEWSDKLPKAQQYHICTGGGGGIMEAANRGAHDAGSPTIGLNISLPFEQNPNKFVTPELNFEFHYFFMRKFWLVYPSHALIVFPGGFGTLDELFEILTLRQTKKMHKLRLIVLYSKEYWSKIINFDYLMEMGMIDKDSYDLFSFANTPEEAFKIIKSELSKKYHLKSWL